MLALAGADVLTVLAAQDDDPWKVVSVSTLDLWRDPGAALSFSMLYHGLRGEAKSHLRKLDHVRMLIASSAAYYVTILRYVP